jgi:hypothetical protein
MREIPIYKVSPVETRSFLLIYPGFRPIGANLFRMFFLKLPQTRHPERSASQIDRVTQRLWRGVEGPRRCVKKLNLIRTSDRVWVRSEMREIPIDKVSPVGTRSFLLSYPGFRSIGANLFRMFS